MRLATTAASGALAVACILAVTTARADDESPSARAERLYAEAQALHDAGRLDEACDRFRESQSVEPALGTLLNVAECDATAGRTASAYAEFTKAVGLARELKEPARVQFASDRAAGLAGRLSVVRFVAPTRTRIVSLRIDGGAAASAPGGPLPMDPGRHHVEATLDVGVVSRDVEVAPGPSRADVPLAIEARSGSGGPATTTRDEARSARRTLGYVLLGTAVVGAATGAVAGVLTLQTASSHCTSDSAGVVCRSDDERAARHEAFVTAWIADVGLAVGGLAAVGAAYLLLTSSPSGGPPRAALRVSPAGLTAVGSF